VAAMSTKPPVRIDSDADEALGALATKVGIPKVQIASRILKDAVAAIEGGQRGELSTVSWLREQRHGKCVVSDDPTLIAAVNQLRYDLHQALGGGALKAAENASEYSARGSPK
jgi:predicted transcriptional regulator